MATHDLLIEIGTEELPPKALYNLTRSFADNLWKELSDRGFQRHGELKFYTSPRRLAVIIEKLETQSVTMHTKKLGPPSSAAYDNKGNPSKAALGFAKNCGVDFAELKTIQTDKGERLYFEGETPGTPLSEILPKLTGQALYKLPIPKLMRWGDSSAEFVRPVHWVIMLLGKDVIDCDILGVKTGRESRGHRFHHPDQITIESACSYVSDLRKAHVWLNDTQGSLNQAISEQVQSLARSVDGVALNSTADSELVAEIAALVEWPVSVIGNFDPKFLALPEEVLIETLEGQQRYFPLRAPDSGELLPHFITVANIESREPERIRAGNERVIVPRLTDAMFFWDKDRAQSLASRVTLLDDMTFQKQLGSLGDKQRRVAQLAEHIATAIGSDPAQARRAAEISKCDLLTDLVGEFPELQGTIGCYIARHDGEPESVAAAIQSHYLPRFAGDRVADTKTGQALAIADRLDTLAGIFAIGQAPTGEKDPFALRRAALGLLRTIIENALPLDLADNLERAATALPEPCRQGFKADEVMTFIMERLRRYYLDNGVNGDSFEAVLACLPTRPFDFHQRLLAVEAFRQLPEAASLAAANKRISNILKQADNAAANAGMDETILQDSAEKQLAKELATLQLKVEPLLANNQYTEALTLLAGLRDSVDTFFESVMVMCEDENLRNNRIALLASLRDLFRRIADISRLQDQT